MDVNFCVYKDMHEIFTLLLPEGWQYERHNSRGIKRVKTRLCCSILAEGLWGLFLTTTLDT